jgi:uncharacterized protein YoxC
MMSPTEIALIVMAAALCILVLTLIPTFLTIKRTAASIGDLAEMVQSELKPTLHELTGVLAELKAVGGGIAEYNDDVKRFMSELGDAGDNLHTINRTVGVVTGVLNTTSAWTTGAKVAGKYLIERFLKKQGGM